jgi:hypothetical protein
MKALGTLGGTGSVAAAIAALGWPAVAVVIALTVTVLAMVAWVLADAGRTRHLAMVIQAAREKR